jgi:hypothetical protein
MIWWQRQLLLLVRAGLGFKLLFVIFFSKRIEKIISARNAFALFIKHKHTQSN